MDCTPAYDESEKRGEELEVLVLDPVNVGEAIEQDESGFQKALGHTPLGYQSLDENGCVLEVNQAWLDILGYSRKEVIGRSFADFLHPDWMDHFKENFPRFKAVGEVLGVEFEMIKGSGSLAYVYFKGRIQYDGDGRFKRTHCILYDLTERKRREGLLQISMDALRDGFNESDENSRKAHHKLEGEIAERKRVEKELFESERRSKDFLENLTDVAYETDASGNITYVNRIAEKVTGIPKIEIIGKPFLSLIAEQSRSKAMVVYQKTLQGETPEYELSLSDGSIYHFKNRAIRNSEGHITGVFGIARDITDKKRTEQRIIKEKGFSDALINSLPGIFYLFDTDGRLLRWNRNFEKISEYSSEEIGQKKPTDFFADNEKDRVARTIQDVLTGGKAHVEASLLTRSGRKIPHFLTGLRMVTDEQVYIVGVGIDITERKRAEEIIRESEERFRTIADFTFDWEYWIDPDGNLLYVSPSCERISGYPAGAFMENPSLISDLVHPDDLDKVRAHVETEESPAENLEFRIVARDGVERWMGHVCQPVFSENGEFLGRRGSNRDITERKNAERALKESNELLSSILTASGVGIAYAKERKIEWANEAMFRLFGFSKEEDYLGKDTRMLYASEEEYIRVGKLTYQSRPGDVVEAEARFKRHHDGSEFYGEIRVNILDPSEPSMGIIVNIMDVTERKLAEEAVRESENQYRILTENIAEGVTIYQGGTLVFVNPAFAAMLGYSAEDLLGKDPIGLVHDDYKEEFQQMAQSAEEGLPKIPGQSVCIRKDGREIWTESYHSRIQWKGAPALLCTVRDITGHKLHELSMEEEAEHLHKENVRLRASIKERYRFGDIIGMSSGMQEVYELIMRAANTDANVIISGESGTGKELIARTIHEMSDRKAMPFVPINCGAVPETLFESEFFGHKKGAFTGAQIDKHGFFDLAQGGTLFLDEVGELTLNMQAKLLRAIEGGGYVAVGGREIKHAEARIISATNRNLSEMVQKGLFREDFFYRLHVIPIRVPPLRDRIEDIPLLVDHYLKRWDGDSRQTIPGQVLEALYRHRWPGNVRELQNLLQRFVTLGRLDFITTKASQENLPADMVVEKFHHGSGALRETMEIFERAFISKVLEQNRWHRGKAAKTLAIPERTLYRKLRQYQLNSSEGLS